TNCFSLIKVRRLEAGIQKVKTIYRFRPAGTVDLVKVVLDDLDIPVQTKMKVWDDYYGTRNDKDFEERLRQIDLSPEMKARLWELKVRVQPVCDARQFELESQLDKIKGEVESAY